MTTTYNFEKLETNIMKVLSRSPDTYMSQYEIYNKLCENFELKDPVEKENLKFRFLIVLRQLSSIFDGVSVLNKNGIFSAGFFTEDDKLDSQDQDFVSVEPEAESSKLPDDLSVVRFIVDENIKEFYNRRDYQGNTILHTLVIHSDFERIQKIIETESCSFSDKNNKGETPLDLISDFKVNNLITKNILDQISDLEYDVMTLKSKNSELENSIKFYLYYLAPVIALVYLKLLFRF
jgi:hypothetical protein